MVMVKKKSKLVVYKWWPYIPTHTHMHHADIILSRTEKKMGKEKNRWGGKEGNIQQTHPDTPITNSLWMQRVNVTKF